MCEPVTIAMVGVAVVGTTVGAIAKKQQADYQGKIAQQNAEYAKQAAGQSMLAGQSKETMSRIQTGAQVGRAKAAFGQSGVLVEEGSPEGILEDTRLMSEYEAQTIRHNSIREAWAHQVGAAGFQAQASEYETAGKNAIVSSVIGGATDVASIGYQDWTIRRRGANAPLGS